MKDYLPETASQTAGPYVHIGLAPEAAGFHIFENNFGPQLATADTEGERITIEGRVIDGGCELTPRPFAGILRVDELEFDALGFGFGSE